MPESDRAGGKGRVAKDFPTFIDVPATRTYVHLTCGNATAVGGSDYKLLCDPYSQVLFVWTMCVHCDRADRLDRFVWVDTKESLADYRRRLKGTVSPLYALWRRAVPIVCFVCLPGGLVYLAARHIPEYPTVSAASALLAGLLIGAVVYRSFLIRARDFRQFR